MKKKLAFYWLIVFVTMTTPTSQGGLVVINRASHLCDPGSTVALRSYVGWVSVDLNLTPRVFLRVLLRFSSLIKVDSRSVTSGRIPSYRDNLWYLSLSLYWMNKVGIIFSHVKDKNDIFAERGEDMIF